MRIRFTVLLVAFVAMIFQPAFAAEPPAPAPMVELDKANKARSKYVSLHKRLDKLREQFEKGDGKRMVGTIKSANRDLVATQKKDADLDLSAEQAELAAFASLAENMVAAAAAAKLRDRAFKSLDREIAKLDKLVVQAERSKPRPEQFQAQLDKADGFLQDALAADPAADGASRQIALEKMPDRYAAAQIIFRHSGEYKAINKRLVSLGKAIDQAEKPVTRLNGAIKKAVGAGDEIWPKQPLEAREKVLAVLDEALAAQPDIDLQEPEAELAALDARIAEIRPGYIQNGLDLYFGDQLDQVSAEVDSLGDSFGQRTSYSTSDLRQRISAVKSVGNLLERSADAYPDSDLSEHDARYTKLSADFDAMVDKHQTRRDLMTYLDESAQVLGLLGSERASDLPYIHKEVLASGIEDFDIETFRQRLSESDDAARAGRADEYYAAIERRMKGNEYINGVKDILKYTNSDSLDLNARTEYATSTVRLALLGQKFYPDDTRYDALVDETKGREAAMAAEKTERFAAASTGPFHIANMDSLVFSTAPLTIGSEDPSLVSETFEAGVPIYGTAYLSLPLSTVSNQMRARENVRLDTQIDGRGCREYGMGQVRGLSADSLDATVVQFVLLPELDGYAYQDRNDSHINFAHCQQANATLGEQDVRVELGLIDPTSPDRDLLEGSFKLAFDAEAPARIKPIVSTLHEMRIDAVRMPEPAMSDTNLEALMAETATLNKEGEPQRVVLNNKSWVIDKNELDIPLRQRLTGRVAMKRPDGTCMYFATVIAREYVGGGTYAPPRPWQMVPPVVPIRCENIGG